VRNCQPSMLDGFLLGRAKQEEFRCRDGTLRQLITQLVHPLVTLSFV